MTGMQGGTGRKGRTGGMGRKGGMAWRVGRVWIFAFMATAVVGASSVAAQDRRFVESTFEYIVGEPSLGPVVRGAPYSGEASTTVTQVLADGTRIERTTVTRVFRDGDGRVRREQTVLGLGALTPSGDAPSVVTISDPVAGVSYVLEPNARRAHRAAISPLMAKIMERRESAGDVPPPLPPPPPPAGERPARRPERIPNWPEPLGTRQIEGLTANGTKRTEVLPVGRIGNDRPIEITDERWESPDLKLTVLMRHHDPRTGDVEYRLTNISRAEPSRDLFVVPPDYTIVEARDERP